MSDLVPVWIFGDEYECPEHYEWSMGPLSDSYRQYLHMVPREQAERWQEVQDAFLEMNREMKVLRQERERQSVTRHSAKGLPW